MSEGPDLGSEQEIYAALRELREEPYGVARSARTEEVVETAERLGLDEPRADAMLELLTAYEYGNELRKAPVLFSRILKLYKEKPEAFDEQATHRVFWCFKWITSALISLPEIPLASIEGWIEQMREHYTAAGKPMQGVQTSRYHMAAHTGIGEQQAYELWVTRPRDEFSDCDACEARNRGRHWARLGNDARALAEWQPVLDGMLSCSEEPAATISSSLLPLVREGRTEEAASLHRSGYRLTKGQVSADDRVGRHLEFLALTGNAARGLELLAENRGRFGSNADAATRLTFLSCVEVLLRQVVAQGGAEIPVPGPDGRTFTAAALLEELRTRTDEIARAFDERNGTSHVSDTLRRRREREPLTREPLPLGVRVASGPISPAPAPTAPAPEVPADFEALLAEARAALMLERPDSEALWAAVAERAGETDIDDVLRAELAVRAGFAHIRKHEMGEAVARLQEAAELFDGAGLPGRAVSRRARAAWARNTGAGDDEATAAATTWSELDALLKIADELQAENRIDAEDYAIVRHSRVAVAASDAFRSTAGPTVPDSAARARFDAEAEALHAAAVRLEMPWWAAVADAMAGDALGHDGEIEAALGRLDSAVALSEGTDRPWTLPQFLAHRAHLLTSLGRLDDGAADQHRALTLLAQWPTTEPGTGADDAVILMELASNRSRAGELTVAISHMTNAAARFDRRGSAVSAARARAMLAQTLLRAERAPDAIAVLESLLDEEAEARLEPPLRAQLRLDLGRALMDQGEPRPAAEVLARLADFVSDWPDQAVLTLVASDLACALHMAGLWEQAGAALRRALEAHAQAPNPSAVCKALRVAAEAGYRGHGPEGVEPALAHLRLADEINEATKEVEGEYLRWPETARNADTRTQALAIVKRDEEALAAALAAAAAWELGGDRVVGEFAESMRVAATIEGFRLGRRREAIARLAPVLERCRRVGHQRAVSVLSQLSENLAKES